MELAWDSYLDLGDPEDGPLHRRLADALRDQVRTGVLPAGSALPPSRQLARELRCSRWVVTEAYGQLVAEGYLESRAGSATRVAPIAAEGGAERPPTPPRTAVRFDLAPGLPDLRAFPRERWSAALRRAVADAPHADLDYPDPAGHVHLRRVLGSYLRRQRAAEVDAGTGLVVTHGITDGVVRVARALATSRASVGTAVEDPGWGRLRTALRGVTGTAPHAVPVDDEGLRVDALARTDATLVVVGVAHQFPTGVVLSPARREQLVAWARDRGATILEDDYDAEFRYDRDPAPSLQGQAPDVVGLLGSVSKSLAPGLALGWLLVPEALAREVASQPHPGPATIEQLALATLLTAGDHDRHLRAVRRGFAERRHALLEELDRHLPDAQISGAAAGLHLLVRLPAPASAAAVQRRAAAVDLRLARLAEYEAIPADDATLVLGYGNLAGSAVPEAVRRLAEVVRRPAEVVRDPGTGSDRSSAAPRP